MDWEIGIRKMVSSVIKDTWTKLDCTYTIQREVRKAGMETS
jgi:hypothetical protein